MTVPAAPAPADISGAPAGPRPDPVRTLLRDHHALCADAVDPLEIAAGLEAHGVTDRTAAALGHRDVFSLAEELHARAERTGQSALSRSARPPAAGEPCPARPGGGGVPGALVWLWLLGYGLAGDLLPAALAHGHRLPGPRALAAAAAPTALALACAVAPAAWCAHAFAGYARRRLADSRSLAEFHGRARRALLASVAVFLGVLCVCVVSARSALPVAEAAAPPALAAVALGALLFLAGLCAAHGLTRPALAAGLAACAAEAAPFALLLAARLPGCSALDRPVTWLTGAHGPAAVPLVACAVPALALLVHAVTVLSRAAVHGREDVPNAPAVHPSEEHAS
ncbi:hypothetical protein I5Q34_15685 [Streptomyces sp. AV19]|uniref:hypothetical protein n=1 Tax=Streptomyces sp. AV19 TaxID=2793068 RepID=UPI0018FEFD36|nr:hypothetical protein [Streptomyces sp. AV19]MBH1935694.1 hypothetical protein [Streptomyces sp. AV19]MDG4536031.1 hypothetical protein [Streptomyces sp. AV19]